MSKKIETALQEKKKRSPDEVVCDDCDSPWEASGEEAPVGDSGQGDSPEESREAVFDESEEESIELYRQRALEAERKYRALSDMRELSAEFEALSDMESTEALPRASEYDRLRNMGFSAREAFLASNSELILRAPSKEHLKSVVTRRAADGGSISDEEYAVIKAVFGDTLSDERISELYKRVSRGRR